MLYNREAAWYFYTGPFLFLNNIWWYKKILYICKTKQQNMKNNNWYVFEIIYTENGVNCFKKKVIKDSLTKNEAFSFCGTYHKTTGTKCYFNQQ